MGGRLSIVATPIGCLEDITLRGLRVLREADIILAEDTRHTRTLCAKHGIATPLRSFHAHSSDDKVAAIIDALRGGAHYALVSDAGTPVVSDPGSYLVNRASAEGITVEAVPGPSAVLAALSVSGLPSRRFVFEGFLARSGKERRLALERIAESTSTTVLFESPHRAHATLRDLDSHLDATRPAVLCRELTKLHEEIIHGTLREIRDELADPPRGEITIVIAGKQGEEPARDIDLRALVKEWQEEGLTTKSMAQRLHDDFGWKRNVGYRAVLDALENDD
jgi:16S rRNA (cytidine1402-2'-O)-methyltransferase